MMMTVMTGYGVMVLKYAKMESVNQVMIPVLMMGYIATERKAAMRKIVSACTLVTPVYLKKNVMKRMIYANQ